RRQPAVSVPRDLSGARYVVGEYDERKRCVLVLRGFALRAHAQKAIRRAVSGVAARRDDEWSAAAAARARPSACRAREGGARSGSGPASKRARARPGPGRQLTA